MIYKFQRLKPTKTIDILSLIPPMTGKDCKISKSSGRMIFTMNGLFKVKDYIKNYVEYFFDEENAKFSFKFSDECGEKLIKSPNEKIYIKIKDYLTEDFFLKIFPNLKNKDVNFTIEKTEEDFFICHLID